MLERRLSQRSRALVGRRVRHPVREEEEDEPDDRGDRACEGAGGLHARRQVAQPPPGAPLALRLRRGGCLGVHAPTFTNSVPGTAAAEPVADRDRQPETAGFRLRRNLQHQRPRPLGERVAALGEQLGRTCAAQLQPGLRRVPDRQTHAERAPGFLPGRLEALQERDEVLRELRRDRCHRPHVQPARGLLRAGAAPGREAPAVGGTRA